MQRDGAARDETRRLIGLRPLQTILNLHDQTMLAAAAVYLETSASTPHR
jgi:hypothetical protein